MKIRDSFRLFARALPLLAEERKQLCQFGFVRTPAVFADFERFRKFYLRRALLSIPIPQPGAETVRNRLVAPRESVSDLLMTLFLLCRIGREQIGGAVGAPLCKLGDDHTQGVEFLLDNRVDRDGDIRLKGLWFLKRVGVIRKYRIVLQIRNDGIKERNDD